MNGFASSHIMHIDFTRALALLQHVVGIFGPDHKASGENESSGCVYFNEDQNGVLTPVCIVGQVFAALGILRALYDPENYSTRNFSACYSGAILWDNAERMGVKFSPAAIELLRSAQAKQDSNWTWGDAVTHAVSEVRQDAQNAVDRQVESLRERLTNESEVLSAS